MFEQSFVNATAKTHRAAPVALSLLLQVTVVGTGIIIPLLNPDLLPRAMMGNTLFLAPPTPPPVLRPREVSTTAKTTKVTTEAATGLLVMPPRVPTKVEMIDDPPIVGNETSYFDSMRVLGNRTSTTMTSLMKSFTSEVTPAPPPPVAPKGPEKAREIVRYRVGGAVQEALLISRKMPDYPTLARAARIEGKVTFQAVIGTTGAIQQLQLVSGHPMLVQSAMEAVRQWRYRPTLLNGDPVEVDTLISVNFTLNR